MVNDTKVAALLRPTTQSMHAKLQQQILDILHNPKYEEGQTRLDLAGLLFKGVNCVTAPVRALLDAGLIVEHERIRQPETGNLAWTLKLKEVE